MRPLALALVTSLGALGAGCSTPDQRTGGNSPARISHIVLAKLNDPGDARALLSEGRQKLATIPGVRSYAQGRPLDAGRPNIDGDYDVAVIMGFDSAEDYRRYVEHPRHQEFVNSWRPRLKWMRIHDVETGPAAGPSR